MSLVVTLYLILEAAKNTITRGMLGCLMEDRMKMPPSMARPTFKSINGIKTRNSRKPPRVKAIRDGATGVSPLIAPLTAKSRRKTICTRSLKKPRASLVASKMRLFSLSMSKTSNRHRQSQHRAQPPMSSLPTMLSQRKRLLFPSRI